MMNYKTQCFPAGNTFYPNPATDVLHFTTQAAGERYVITDATGRTLLQGSLDNVMPVADVHSLGCGSYFVRIIHSSNSSETYTFIKQ